MKPKIIGALLFLTGMVLGALCSPARYELVASATMPAAWRLDRLTGSVEFMTANGFSRPIKSAENPPIP